MTLLQHLEDRYLDVRKHTVWLNDAELTATFPLWNLSGQMVGYHQYRPDKTKDLPNNPKEGRYFTKKKNAPVALWGMETWSYSRVLYVTEGLFDAARLTRLGYSAVAVLANDVDRGTKSWFKLVRSFRPVVAVCDNDSAGRRLASLGTYSHVVEDYKDLGEASTHYVTELVKRYNRYETLQFTL